ncbi:hypothetical protein IT570_01390 [Candidatus Sumerlaeota bacterium]|nr:hypothetical protein [Candidatus Sumerlaeota bacterium]
MAAPFYDILFFIFPTLLSGLFVSMYIILGPKGHAVLNAGVILLSLIHVMGTWMFFLNKEHFSYYMKQPVKFLVVPIFFLVGSIALGCLEYIKGWQTGIVALVSYAWTHYHLTKQNVGFVGFYRTKMGIKDPAFRGQDVRLIYSYALTAYGYGWYTDPYALGAGLRGVVSDYIFGGFACWFVYELIKYTQSRISLIRQYGLGSWRYFAMMLTTLSFPLPMLFLMVNPRPMFVVWGVLTFGLVAHYVQYIAVVALVHWHKDRSSYPSPEGFDPSQVPTGFSLKKSGLKGLLGMITLGVATYALYQFFLYLGGTSKQLEIFQAGIGPGILTGLGFIHVWHDSMIWQPRDEFNRKNTLRFVRPFAQSGS